MFLKLNNNPKLKGFRAIRQLEYLESTGTQYIDTKISCPNGFRLITDHIVPKDLSGVNDFAGSYMASNSNQNIFRIYNSGWYICSRGRNNYYGTVKANTNYSIDISNQNGNDNLTVNSVILANNVTTGTPPYSDLSIWLFALHRTDSTDYQNFVGEIGETRIYDENNVLKIHFVPCLDDNDIPCMYDTVSETFFYNQGTGDFIAGPSAGGIAGSITSVVAERVDKLFIRNCQLFEGYVNLKKIYDVQSDNSNVILSRIRVDIGNVSGSLSELMQYAGMAGFNDAGEEQVKPRLVGTWTINDWHTTAQLAQVQAAFDGLTVVGDNNYLINFNDLAVQTLDDAQPNYNPAAAIILQAQNLGITLDAPVVTSGGRYMLRKNDIVSKPTTIDIYGKTDVIDSNGIVSEDTTLAYTFSKFNEFIFFNGLSTLYGCFHGCGLLTELQLPINITRLDTFTGSGDRRYFKFPENITNILYLYNITIFCAYGYIFSASNVINIRMSNPPSGVNLGTTPNYYNGCTILIGTKDKYADKELCDYYKNSSGRYNNAISYYDYITPKLSYDGTNVTITLQIAGTVYYTTDGSTPTEQSNEYTQPFAWNGQGVIKAIGVNTKAKEDDRITYADDFYAQTCVNPTITVSNNQITISCATSGAVIHYTIDGSYPTPDSLVYSDIITSQEDILKVRCFATKEGMNDSEVVSKICVMDDSLWGTDSDNSFFAVQCIDSTKPNYNPAVCIILCDNNKLTDDLFGGGGGYISKTDAAAITNMANIFQSKTTVADVKGIVTTNTTQNFNFETFNEFKFFGVTELSGYYRNITNFRHCNKLTSIIFPDSITTIRSANPPYDYDGCFAGCTSLTNVIINKNLSSIGNGAFSGCSSLPFVHLFNFCTMTTEGGHTFESNTKIYVGSGESASDDNTLLNQFLQDATWSHYYSNNLDTWYNYLHPTT